ncbi:hypothetical protein [Aliikangiella maris]|uniref:Uncharacterized protein n=1 Tax=Aliikangiella maris TaxID=3162458 RepID=A0ABV3MS86_9GAMM
MYNCLIRDEYELEGFLGDYGWGDNQIEYLERYRAENGEYDPNYFWPLEEYYKLLDTNPTAAGIAKKFREKHTRRVEAERRLIVNKAKPKEKADYDASVEQSGNIVDNERTHRSELGRDVPNGNVSRAEALRAKWGDLSGSERSALVQAKAEANAGRRLAELEQSTGAHFKTSHGADVTPIQHRKRARLGINPRPEVTNRSRQNSTGFLSNRDQLNIMNRASLIRSRADNPHLVNDIVFEHPDVIGTGFSKRVFSLNENLSYMSRVRFNAQSGNMFTAFPIHPHAVTPSTVLKVKY